MTMTEVNTQHNSSQAICLLTRHLSGHLAIDFSSASPEAIGHAQCHVIDRQRDWIQYN